jgi:hypothetical protein
MVVNTLTPLEKQERLAAIDAHMHSIVERKRAQWNGEAYLIQVGVSLYFSKVDTSGATVLKVSNMNTVSKYAMLVFAICVSIVWSYFVQFYVLPVLFIPIAAVIAYKVSKAGGNNILASLNMLRINGNEKMWQDVFKCYVVQLYKGKEEQQLLYVFDKDGEMSEFDVTGLDKYRVAHLIASYQQAYNKHEGE